MKPAFKNKWLLFVLFIWAVIVAVPAFRLPLKAILQGSPWLRFSVIPTHYTDSQFGSKSPELPLRVNSIKGGFDAFEWPKNFETLDKLDQLIDKNPNLPWLIALRLQITTTIFQKNRIGGELSDGLFKEHLQAGIPSPETNGKKVNFTPKQMQQTLALCQQGEKLEPQNAFFSWMRACFLLINWQDQKAWKALDEAAHKTYWNNHNAEFLNLSNESMSKMLGRSMLPMEELNYIALNDFFQTGAPKREVGRIINWEGIKLKRKGKNAQALQIWSNFHHTMTLATQGDATFSDFLVDASMVSLAQYGATYKNRNELKKKKRKAKGSPSFEQSKINSEKQRQKMISGFIAYAEKYHRPDLARQIKKDAEQSHQLIKRTSEYIGVNVDPISPIVRSQFRRLNVSGGLFVIGVVLILSLIGSLILWIILQCYELFLSDKSTFTKEISSSRLSEIALGAISCSAIWSILCWMILVGDLVTVTKIVPGTLADFSNGWLLLPFSIHISFQHFFGKLLNFGGSIYGNDLLPTWRVLVLLTPILMGSLYVLQKRVERQAKSDGKKVWSGRALFRRFFSRRWDRPFVTGLLGWIGKRIFILLFFLCWGALPFTIQFMNAEDQTNQIILAVFTIVLLLMALFWLIRAIKPASFPYGFQLFKQSLAGWISFASVLILAILIGSVIINRPLQKWSDTEMRGEMWQIHRVKNMPATKR